MFSITLRCTPTSSRFPYTTLFRSPHIAEQITRFVVALKNQATLKSIRDKLFEQIVQSKALTAAAKQLETDPEQDRKSTRLNSSHVAISYAVFCLKKKTSRAACQSH